VRSKRAIVSLSLLSLVFYLGVFCEGDNLWCVCVGVLYLWVCLWWLSRSVFSSFTIWISCKSFYYYY
jgi:hypothetical protein